jgi:hypothetical protein
LAKKRFPIVQPLLLDNLLFLLLLVSKGDINKVPVCFAIVEILVQHYRASAVSALRWFPPPPLVHS